MSRYTVVAHRDLAILNPLSSETLDDVIAQLALSADARVVDIGCGKGELLRRIAARYGCRAVGIDSNAELIADARIRVTTAELHVARATEMPLADEAWDLAACVGASHAFGSTDDTLGALSRAVRTGGTVLFGEGYWRRPPDPEYLAAFGGSADELMTLDQLVARAWPRGLVLRGTFLASENDFARYEEAHARAVAAYASEHPSDEQAAAMLTRSRGWFDAFQRWGRTTMGFALLVFERDERSG